MNENGLAGLAEQTLLPDRVNHYPPLLAFFVYSKRGNFDELILLQVHEFGNMHRKIQLLIRTDFLTGQHSFDEKF